MVLSFASAFDPLENIWKNPLQHVVIIYWFSISQKPGNKSLDVTLVLPIEACSCASLYSAITSSHAGLTIGGSTISGQSASV